VTDPADDVRRALTELVRASGRDVLATLARWTGNLALAEDAVQDATIKALETWPRDGVPDQPVAWLRTVPGGGPSTSSGGKPPAERRSRPRCHWTGR